MKWGKINLLIFNDNFWYRFTCKTLHQTHKYDYSIRWLLWWNCIYIYIAVLKLLSRWRCIHRYDVWMQNTAISHQCLFECSIEWRIWKIYLMELQNEKNRAVQTGYPVATRPYFPTWPSLLTLKVIRSTKFDYDRIKGTMAIPRTSGTPGEMDGYVALSLYNDVVGG